MCQYEQSYYEAFSKILNNCDNLEALKIVFGKGIIYFS